ncbi:MAG TPA: beta-ketoacyl-[acyl-carrier-protein] synthase family protein [Opitutales bacterium]|jgi:3-oxoacyl-[acyl-carrier-protein] synthase II|nr:beta-ketoacyl-[acyl-carrier-protein] synthase family protein [Opitutales bacterium]
MALTHPTRGNLRPVYVTGLGLISAAGADVGAAWAQIASGQPVVKPVARFDIRGCECQVAAQVNDNDLLPAPLRARWPRFVRLGHTALDAALIQAELRGGENRCLDPTLPLWCSTTGGGTEYGETCVVNARAGQRSGIIASSMRYQARYLPHALQETYGLRGAAVTLSNACASGADLIGTAANLVASGRVERIAAGGAESLSTLLFHGFSCLRALSPTTCRPFSVSRDGLWLGEGAAFVILESEAEVIRRKVTPLAQLAGYGQATDLHHIAHPHPEGIALKQALEQALAQAGVAPEEVAYVNTHGTATPANDEAEGKAYERVFGGHLPRIALSSIKNITGHTLGAAGAIEAVLTIEALRRAAPLPAALLPDPIPNLAASLARSREVRAHGRAFVSTNSGFGGANAALVFLPA